MDNEFMVPDALESYSLLAVPPGNAFNIRVIQKNLVYVIGIPAKYTDEALLRQNDFFGQFGPIRKIIVNRRTPIPELRSAETARLFPSDTGRLFSLERGSDTRPPSAESTASAYITYASEADARCCIEEVDESLLDGRVLRATYGTTKYCSFYLKGVVCQNTECMYLHEHRPAAEVLTKDELVGSKHRLHGFPSKNKNAERLGRRLGFKFLEELIPFKQRTDFHPPQQILFEPLDLPDP